VRTWRWLIFTACALLPSACAGPVDESRSEYLTAVNDFAQHHYQHAEQHLRASIHLAAKKDALRNQLADSLLFLAQVESEEGKYASAEKSLKQAVEVLTVACGAQSRKVAAAWQQLAVCHYLQEEYSDAAAAAGRALAIESITLPKNDLLIAATDNNLAESYEKLQVNSQAEQLFKRAIDIYASHGSEPKASLGLIETLNNLALFYRHENRLSEAKATAQKALSISGLTADGVAVPATIGGANLRMQPSNGAAALNTMAAVERAQFDFDAAGDHYRKAISLLSGNAPGTEELLCRITDNYADMMLDQKDWDAAEKVYKVSIEHCRHAHGDMHPMVAERMNDLSDVYRHQGRYLEAEALLEQVLAIDRIAFESDSPITFASMNSLSSVYLAQKKFDQAQSVYADWVPVLVSVLGPDHPHVADAMDNWALVAERSNNTQAAMELRLKAKKIRRASEQPLDKTPTQRNQ
jgi:tetratricopeptide (TPR) repeat protein